MNKLTTFYLVRHGKTLWNEKKLLQGQLDSPLTTEGITQAKNLAKKLKGVKFDLVFSSDLLRAKRTAEIVVLERDLEIKTSELLRERNFGHLQGKSEKEWDSVFKKLSDEQKFSYKHSPQIESDEELVNRLLRFIREVAIRYPGKNVLVVTHGGVIRVSLYKFGIGDYKSLPPGSVKNTGFVKLLSDGVDFFVKEISGISINNQSAK